MPPKRKAVNADDGDTERPPSNTRILRNRRQISSAPPESFSDADQVDLEAMPSAPKQNAPRSAKRGPWGEEYLMTNPKSALVNADLVKLFSNPKAWECLDEDEKQHLISLLPAHIHPNPDPDPDNPDAKIPPLPEQFLRYDNNWRAALRNFQSDLETGRYKPEWQRQAREAVKERAEGKFDDFKEREFEQFWGQKQKIDYGLIAGESSKVKLATLIKHGVVRVGDVWKYSRIFSKKNDKNGQTLVEKEAKIIAIDGANMSFLVPTGQRVFLSTVGETEKESGSVSIDRPEKHTNHDENILRGSHVGSEQVEQTEFNSNHPQNDADLDSVIDSKEDGTCHSDYPNKADGELSKDPEVAQTSTIPLADAQTNGNSPPKRLRGRPKKRKASSDGLRVTRAKSFKQSKDAEMDSAQLMESSTPLHVQPESISTDAQAEAFPGLNVSSFLASAAEVASAPAESDKPPSPPNIAQSPHHDRPTSSEHSNTGKDCQLEVMRAASTTAQPEFEPQAKSGAEHASSTPLETTIRNISGPNALTKKILEIDGRIKQPPNGNAWKEIRCYRDNQDMGSLWEIRQALYVKFRQD